MAPERACRPMSAVPPSPAIGNGLHVAVGDPSLAPQGLKGRFDTGSHGGGVLEGDVDIGHLPGRLGVAPRR